MIGRESKGRRYKEGEGEEQQGEEGQLFLLLPTGRTRTTLTSGHYKDIHNVLYHIMQCIYYVQACILYSSLALLAVVHQEQERSLVQYIQYIY